MYDIKLNALPPENLQVISSSRDNLPNFKFLKMQLDPPFIKNETTKHYTKKQVNGM
jgi:hypothetical protein